MIGIATLPGVLSMRVPLYYYCTYVMASRVYSTALGGHRSRTESMIVNQL